MRKNVLELGLCLLLLVGIHAMAAETPLIFIHGIKGGKLLDGRNKLVWMNGLHALGLSTPDLKLPLSWKGEYQDRDDCTQAGVLEEVVLIPWLYAAPVYGPWLKAARAMGNSWTFSYDWRRDNLETVGLFETFVEETVRASGKKATVVAHSMGGLITLALLNRRPDLFRAVVFSGVPFIGGIGFLPDLHSGTANGWSKRILPPDTVGTYPSVYGFFPDGPHDRLRDPQGNPIAIDFYSVAGWKEQKLGYFRPSAQRPPEVETFLPTALERAKNFRAQLVAKEMPYPPILVITGRSLPTLTYVIKDGPKAVDGWDFDSGTREMGDGRVLEKNSLPPQGIPYELFASEAEHSAQLNDPKVHQRIRSFLSK